MRKVKLALVGLVFSSMLCPLLPVAAASSSPAAVTVSGRGWGHGRGMGQYGALGYAINSNYSYLQILSHYYSNTTAGSVSNSPINVRITDQENGELIVQAANAYRYNSTSVAAGKAIRITRVGANTFRVLVGNSCSGPWVSPTDVSGTVTIEPPSTNPRNSMSGMLQRCTSYGTRAYRGKLKVVESIGFLRVVNEVLLEDYLRGVIPRESPASWGDLAGGKGAQQLRAQAVAARSYAMSENRYSYAKTCDSTSCQVYGGAFLNGVRIEDPRSDAAVVATAGQVRKLGTSIARTEFSASTGGFSAGGTFPAVEDKGDAVANNAYHSWTTTLSASVISNAYPVIGRFSTIVINARNGLGDKGGRVASLSIIGSSGQVTISGAEFRSKFSLRSDWFSISGVAPNGVSGYRILDGYGGVFTFGSASFKGSLGGKRLSSPIIAMAPKRSGKGYWLVASNGSVYNFGDAANHGSMAAKRLRQPITGIAGTATGKGYWLVAADGAVFSFGDAHYLGGMNGKLRGNRVVGISSNAEGNGYWLVGADGAVFSFGKSKYAGGANGKRLAKPIVSLTPTPSGKGYWLLSANGSVFSYGDAQFRGSASTSGRTFVSMTRTGSGLGYYLLSSTGTVYSFGDAPNLGSMKRSLKVLAVHAV